MPVYRPHKHNRGESPSARKAAFDQIEKFAGELVEGIQKGDQKGVDMLLNYYIGKSARWSANNMLWLMVQGVRHPATPVELKVHGHEPAEGANAASIFVPVVLKEKDQKESADKPNKVEEAKTVSADDLLLTDERDVKGWVAARAKEQGVMPRVLMNAEFREWRKDPANAQIDVNSSECNQKFFADVRKSKAVKIEEWKATQPKEEEVSQPATGKQGSPAQGGDKLFFRLSSCVYDLGRNTKGPDILESKGHEVNPKKIMALLKRHCQRQGIEVVDQALGKSGGSAFIEMNGIKKIEINPNLGDGAKVVTLLHEIAHHDLHFNAKGGVDDKGKEAKKIREMQAEAVAYVTARSLGVKSDYSCAYLQGWGATAKELLDNQRTVIRCSQGILGGVAETMDQLRSERRESLEKAESAQSQTEATPEQDVKPFIADMAIFGDAGIPIPAQFVGESLPSEEGSEITLLLEDGTEVKAILGAGGWESEQGQVFVSSEEEREEVSTSVIV